MAYEQSGLIEVTFAIDAWGQAAGGVWPHLALKLDGATIGQTSVASATASRYSFKAMVAPDKAHALQLVYDNDGMANGADRNLFVRSFTVNGKTIATTDPSVRYDKGALDGRDVVAGQEAMYWKGALNVALPATLFPAPAPKPDDHIASANVSSDRPPLAADVSTISWGADRGLAPQHMFWESVPDYASATHMKETRDVAAGHLADGVMPLIGLQLWEDTMEYSLPGGKFSALAGHKAWIDWVKAHPQYLGVNPQGKIHNSDADNPYGWGYVSPLMPLDARDAPAGWTGGTAHYADLLADKLGRLAAHTGTRGFEFADFFDGSPHSGVMNYFNPRMIAEFSAKTGIKPAGSSLTEQAADIRAHYPTQYLDYFVDGWAYGWKALDQAIVKHTGQPAWLSTQVSFTPAAMREFAGVDVRVLGKTMNLNDILFNVQTLERFEMQHKQAPASYEQAMLGIHAARAPDGHYGHMLSSSEDDYWGAVNSLYTGLTGTAREELGWGRLEQTWLQSGWTNIVEADGDLRRATEVWSRSYHDWGQVEDSWLTMLRDIVPTRSFGPALYYSVNAERAMNALQPTGNDIGNAYLGELLTPITRLHDAGVPFGTYVSDAALPSINASNAPSTWIIPQRTYDGKDLFTDAEINALKAIAPVLVGDQAIGYRHPLTFTDSDPGAQITGYGFYDQKDRLIVVASDRVDFDDTAARRAVATHIELSLKDGHYRVEDLIHHTSQSFDVTGGSGGFDTTIGRWDTGVYAITADAMA